MRGGVLKYLAFAAVALTVSCGSNHTLQSTAKQTERSAAPKDYVVILSMDAFRYDLASIYHTPALDSVAAVGVSSQIKPCFPSVTFPNHYAMATGLYPDHNGIVANTFRIESVDKQFKIADNRARKDTVFYRGEPIWNTAERQGKKVNVFGWVGVEAKINGRQPTVAVEYAKHRTRRQLADMVIEAMCQERVEDIPDLVMFYFDQPDAISHAYTSTSPETKEVVEDIDAVVRYLLREIRRSPVYDHINFIFTADHGMTDLSPDRYVNLYPLLDSKRMELWDNTTPLMLQPKADYIDQAFETIAKVPHLKVYRRGELPERFHWGSDPDREKPLVVVPDLGWRVTYSPNDNPPAPHTATHGFDPDLSDMQMVFYGFGPQFKRGYHHDRIFENLNDYIILCHLLGIEPATNDCSFEEVEGLFETDQQSAQQ